MRPRPKPRVRSHRDLIIWQKGMALVDATYDLTENYPDHEKYGIRAQMRRGAISIPANIAEGQGRNTTKDFLRFLGIAKGSLHELDTYFDVSQMRRFATEPELRRVRELVEVVGRLHTNLCAALRKRMRRNH